MPPRKTDDETHYHIVLIDAERNSIRFGPFTLEEAGEGEGDVAEMANGFRKNLESNGVQSTLVLYGLWGGIEVRLRGDDGTDECLTEIPHP